MKMLDENGVEIFEYDPQKGRLHETDVFVKHHEEIKGVAEKGHYVTVKEYPNGGKEVEWVVDVPGVEAKEAWDEYETVLQFVPFTESEWAQFRIIELKQFLRETDYNILKIVEGATTLADCAAVILKRAAWRKEINEIEEREGKKLNGNIHI